MKMIDEYAQVYNNVLFSEMQPIQSKIIDNSTNFCMTDSDIFSHTHRMYLIGENSISFPWFIPKDFPNKALNQTGMQKLLKFIKKDAATLDWTI